ncbi:hypothetical protein Q73A0000_12085 [Kaistella flava (ex Peng et al. 2021)]|uniref:TraB/GumN family protein n=1 Tax=Kaistella flava (ex Peng et al. 2021) TaxID=2038776 RepID=A0A7M2YCD5_9FLAO|nr:DUF5694 domain-containing protein [Kaistella flava (ex Peng et al. 2021)]QOW11043.1 hypothetical protein Q73A0000_12085 [Kaistella flava (ex Peng et al. 2021)]
MKAIFTFLLALFYIFSFSQTQTKTDVILIGVSHFNNPGFDRGKVAEINILDKTRQKDLEEITNEITEKFHPDKVFVESLYKDKKVLDQQYFLYKENKPFYNLDTIKDNFYKRFYQENEIFQFGFRLAKKSKNDFIYSIDYNLEQRYDLLNKQIEKSAYIDSTLYQSKMKSLSSFLNNCVKEKDLKNILKCINSKEQRELNKGFYISTINRLNNDELFFGSDFVASWYKRNLIMYSNIQNQVSKEDKTIVIIVGAGHSSMLYDFLKNDSNYNLIEFNQVIE